MMSSLEENSKSKCVSFYVTFINKMKDKITFLLYNDRIRQFVRFCLVGAIATAVDAALFYLLRQWLPYQASMIISYTSCLCLNMVLTLLWTFNTEITPHNAISVVAAHLFNLFVVRFGLMAIFINVLQINDKLAFIPTLCISTMTNFFIIKTILNKKCLQNSIFLLLLSILLVTLFSTCSPLYPINPWDDANVFMTIGKSILKGKILYKDIFDQKGPILFFIHEFAAAISYTSFIGVYFWEILSFWCFTWCGLKTIRLFSDSPLNMPLICLLSLLTITSDAFFYGDSAEEFCLPFIAYALFLMLRFVKTQESPHRYQALLLGIGAGIILWIKFNIFLFIYGGSLLALIYIAYQQGQLRQLGRIVILALLGITIVTIAVLAYFIAHDAVDSLVDSYFYTNLFKYSGTSSNGEPDVWWFIFVKLAILVVLLLPILLTKAQRNVKLLVLGSYGTLLLSFTFLTVQFYYILLLYVYSPLFIVYFRNLKPTMKTYSVIFTIVIGAVALNWNIVSLLNGTFSHLTLDITEIINRNKTEDSEVINFASYDTGIYLKSRHLPPCRNFFINNFEDEEIREKQRTLVNSGKIKYLAREVIPVKTSHDFYDIPIPENYHLVYKGEENFRYRFYTLPHKYLWNLGYLRPFLSLFMCPETEQRQMFLYERIP